jgi:hypothetical protein
MPAAVVTAKERFIYVVTFPDADSPVEKWDVEEFEIRAGTFAKDPLNEKCLLDWASSRHMLQLAGDFAEHIGKIKKAVYENFRDGANKSRLSGEKAGRPYVDGTVAVTGDFVMERSSLGRVPTFFSPEVAQKEFIATLDQEGRIIRRKDRTKDDPDDAKYRRKSLIQVMEDRSPAAVYEVNSEALASCLIEHVQSQFLLDMFSKDGGGGGDDLPLSGIDVVVPPEGSSDVNNADDSSGNSDQPRLSIANEDDSDFHFLEAGLDSKDKVMFSRAWKFDNEYDEFYTNWVSGWYLSKLIQTGHRYDAETALIFDFGSGESKVRVLSLYIPIPSLLPTPYSLLPTPYSLIPTPYSLRCSCVHMPMGW